MSRTQSLLQPSVPAKAPQATRHAREMHLDARSPVACTKWNGVSSASTIYFMYRVSSVSSHAVLNPTMPVYHMSV